MSKFAQEDRLQPGDRDDPIFTLQCSDINQAIVDAKNERLQHEAKIAETRVRDQALVAFPFGFLLPTSPLALLADRHMTEREAIMKLEERLDRLDRIRTAKHCEAP